MAIVGVQVRRDLIERQEPGSGFTFVPMEVLKDKRLCLSARGLLANILSFGDDWDIEQARADELKRRKAGIEYGEYVDILVVELEKAGYLTVVRG